MRIGLARAQDAFEMDGKPVLVALFVFVAYYLGTRLGLALTFQPLPISALWPPNSILLAALLLTPPRYWGLPIVAVLPAHVLGQLQGDVPNTMIAAWYVSNCSEALIGAALIHRLAPAPFHFHSLGNVSIFVGCGVFAGPLLSSFVDAAFVRLVGWGEVGHRELWRMRFCSNALAALTIVPAVVTWAQNPPAGRQTTLASRLEAAVFTLGLILVAALLLDAYEGTGLSLAVACAPVPFLVWAALRFGPGGTSLTLLATSLVAIWGAAHGRGPFAVGSPAESATSVQIFLTLLAIPLLALSAVVAERKKANSDLSEKQDQLQVALGAARIGTWRWDIAAQQGAFSAESARILGRSSQRLDVTIDVIADFAHPDDRERVRWCTLQAIAEASRYEVEFRVVHPDGSMHWVMAKGEVLFDQERRANCLFGVIIDITDAKRAAETLGREVALRESETRFRGLADSLPHVVWAARADGFIDYFNRRWYDLTGADPGWVGESSWIPLLHPDDRAPCRKQWNDAIRTGVPFEMEYRLLCAAQRDYRWQMFRALPVQDESGTLVRWNGTATDIHDAKMAGEMLREIGERANVALRHEIAEHKKTEGALTHLTRVAILGELTGALAHELNQPLTAILANAQAMQRFIAGDNIDIVEVRETLKDIIADDKRASEVIKHLRGLLKKSDPEFHPIAVEGVVSRALEIADYELAARRVSIEPFLQPSLPMVHGDKVQLEQVILNLILNACEAMDDTRADQRRLRIEARLDAAGKVEISVIDSGPGIDPSHLEMLFTPFFTTRPQGLGLGLSISRSIVSAHGGGIVAENVPAGGSRFTITLPALAEVAA